MEKSRLAWHFINQGGTLSKHKPGQRSTKVKVGSTYRVTGTLRTCGNGLHYSYRAIDALKYTPGPIICRVKISKERIDDDDKGCARWRRVLWMADASHTLHEFAVWCARAALEAERAAGREPDKRSWDVLDVKLRWLNGKATDEELDAAKSAAESAAESAVESAAKSAAESAAWSAAWSATESAAWSATESATESTARSAQNTRLEELLSLLAPADFIESAF